MRRGANTFPSYNRLPNPRFGCETLSFPFLLFRFTSSVSFPSFGINNARWRLFCHFLSPVVFFAHCIFSGCDSWRLCWGPCFPKRVPPSFCRFLICWVFILLYSYLSFSIYLLYCIVYIWLPYLLVLFVRWVLYPDSSAIKIGEWHSLVDLCGVIP